MQHGVSGMRYRQRFTWVGFVGAALLVIGPSLAGIALGEYATTYGARFPDMMILISGVAFTLGALMVLIGRETYTYEEPQSVPHITETTAGSLDKIGEFQLPKR